MSGDKILTGRTGRRCPKQLKWIMVQVAHATSRVRGSRLKRFFLRVKVRRGFMVAVVALARKILSIIWHLIVKGEVWDEPLDRPRWRPKALGAVEVLLSTALDVVLRAGYTVLPRHRGTSFSW